MQHDPAYIFAAINYLTEAKNDIATFTQLREQLYLKHYLVPETAAAVVLGSEEQTCSCNIKHCSCELTVTTETVLDTILDRLMRRVAMLSEKRIFT